MNKKMLKLFIKESGVPIPVVDVKSWDYYIDLYDDHYGSKQKWEDFKEIVNVHTDDSSYYVETKAVIEKVVDFLKEKSAYKCFINDTFEKPTCTFSKKNIYNNENYGENFISIDLVQANFQVFKKLGIIDEPNYEHVISHYTNYKHIINSKRIRQVIFGNLNPKKQIQVQKLFISNMVTKLKEFDIVNISNDEIIIKSNDDTYEIEEIQNALDNCYEYKIEKFRLYKVPNYPFYVKGIKTYDSRYMKEVIKSVPIHYIPQVIKYIRSEEVIDLDLKFMFDGQICTFENKLDFELTQQKDFKKILGEM